MSSGCETLSPRPAAFTGPISTISADNFLGLESDHGNDSNRSSKDGFVDLESGHAHEGPIADGVEMSPLPRRLPSEEPGLMQKSMHPMDSHSTVCAVEMT